MSDENISKLHKLNFNFSIKDRFINVFDNNGDHFEFQTPFLKVLKPSHTTLNKKKTIAKKYLILETNDELDFNNQIGEFMFIINKIHEVSQEKIRENSLTWFNTEFDDIGLDIKVRRPIDQQKDSEFIKISIPKDNNINDDISTLSKGDYVLCDIVFKGLKVSSDNITEEWELKKIITQEKYDEMLNNEYICNNIGNIDLTNTILDENTEIIDPLEPPVELESKENIENITENDIEVISILDEPVEVEEVKVITKSKVKNNKEKSNISKIAENKLKKQESSKNTELIKKFSKKIIFT
jgi:hypothetical protein